MPANPDGTDLFLSSGTWSLVGFESDRPVLGADAHAAWLAGHASAWGAVGVAWYENAGTADAAVGVLRAVLHGTADNHAS